MAQIQISIINASVNLDDTVVQRALPALQTQISRDFSPVWGIDADLNFVSAGNKPLVKSWWLVILDDSEQANILGYHDLTGDGLPLAKVFMEPGSQHCKQWTVTASHALLEMLGDPDINLTATAQDDNQVGRRYAYEVCDACEDDEYSYSIDGVRVSNFVYPAWFQGTYLHGDAQFDHRRLIKEPFQLLKGCRIGVCDAGMEGHWMQLTEQGVTRQQSMRSALDMRHLLRHTPRAQWVKSAHV